MEVPETARKRQTPARAHRAARLRCAILAAWSVCACNLDNPGTSPPPGALSYPIALALGKESNGKASKLLYVANSNFDLRYNAGSIQAYDLDKIAKAIAAAVDGRGCDSVGVTVSVPDGGVFEPADSGALPSLDAGQLGDASMGPADAAMSDAGASVDAAAPQPGTTYLDEADSLPSDYEIASEYGTLRGTLCDGRDPDGSEACCLEDNMEYLVSEVLIDSYAAGIAYAELATAPAVEGMETAPPPQRLYVAQRGRDRLLYIDTDESGALNCGADKGRCTRGPDDGDPDLDPDADFAAQPKDLTVGKLADLAQMSVDGDPTFIATVHEGGQVGLSIDEGDEAGPKLHSVIGGAARLATSVTFNPAERALYLSSAASPSIDRYATLFDTENKRWVLYPSVPLQTTVDLRGAATELAGADDIRDVLVDDRDPKRLFVLMRGVGVNSVLLMERDPELADGMRVTSATRVGEGPSKLAHAALGDRRLLFVSCFDARAIFVVDESNGELVSVIRGLSGPFDLVVDTARNRLYVADFRANVLRVVDVRGLVDASKPPPRIVATIGKVRFGGKLE